MDDSQIKSLEDILEKLEKCDNPEERTELAERFLDLTFDKSYVTSKIAKLNKLFQDKKDKENPEEIFSTEHHILLTEYGMTEYMALIYPYILKNMANEVSKSKSNILRNTFEMFKKYKSYDFQITKDSKVPENDKYEKEIEIFFSINQNSYLFIEYLRHALLRLSLHEFSEQIRNLDIKTPIEDVQSKFMDINKKYSPSPGKVPELSQMMIEQQNLMKQISINALKYQCETLLNSKPFIENRLYSRFTEYLLDNHDLICSFSPLLVTQFLSLILDKSTSYLKEKNAYETMNARLESITEFMRLLKNSKCSNEKKTGIPLDKIVDKNGKFNPVFVDILKDNHCTTMDEVLEVYHLDVPKYYKPIRKLGKGGSGSVYLVENTTDHLKEAIKILDIAANKGSPEETARAIESELKVRRLNTLRSPYIPVYYSVTPHNGKFIISMEPYEKTLAERLEEAGGKLPLPEAMRYFEQLCETLTICHNNGIVHKDFAPHNIGIDESGSIKLSDFGNPLTTIDKKLMPPPLDYSSPRILASEKKLEVLPQDNVWGLGVLLYKMITGKLPFSNPSLPRCERTERIKYIIERQKEYQEKGFDYLIENKDDIEIKKELFAVHSLFQSSDALFNLYESIRQKKLDDLLKNKRI